MKDTTFIYKYSAKEIEEICQKYFYREERRFEELKRLDYIVQNLQAKN